MFNDAATAAVSSLCKCSMTQCCICRLVTNNLCVSTWAGTEEYCRTEAMGVILGVVDSKIVETNQKNLLN